MFFYSTSIPFSVPDCSVQVESEKLQFLGDFLAVGSWFPDNIWPYNIKAELYNDESDVWTDAPDYPYSGTESNFNFLLTRKITIP